MKKIILSVLIALMGVVAVAQDNMTQSATNLVQSINLNPAQRPERGFVSIPIIGSFQVGLYNSFSYSDIISKTNSGKYLNLPSLISTSSASGNMINMNLNLDIVNVGFYVAPNDFLNISLRTRVHVASTYPTGLLQLVSDNKLGSINNYDITMSPNALAWAEFGVGYSRSIQNFTVGARFKYIEGIGTATTPQGVNFTANKTYDSYMISGDYALNAAGLSMNDGSWGFQYLASNPGFAFDLGATWLSDDERIAASVSVSDIGWIFWNDKNSTTIKTRNPGQMFEYSGLGNLLDQDLNLNNMMDSVITGFNKTVAMDTISGKGFVSSMPTTFQAMGSYSLGRQMQHNLSLGFVGTMSTYRGFDYAISAGYAYRSPNKVWQLMGNYTFRSNNPINIGIGAVMTTGVFQLYLATDNVISFFSGLTARNANVRLGLNFFFGPVSARR